MIELKVQNNEEVSGNYMAFVLLYSFPLSRLGHVSVELGDSSENIFLIKPLLDKMEIVYKGLMNECVDNKKVLTCCAKDWHKIRTLENAIDLTVKEEYVLTFDGKINNYFLIGMKKVDNGFVPVINVPKHTDYFELCFFYSNIINVKRVINEQLKNMMTASAL